MAVNIRSAPAWSWFATPLALGCLGGVLYLWLAKAPRTMALAPAAAVTSIAAPASPVAVAAGETLPGLDQSDGVMRDALVTLVGAPTFAQMFTPSSIIRTLVATVDALPRHRMPPGPRPVVPALGAFMSASDDQASVLAADNFPRYAAHVAIVRNLDPARLGATYLRYHPLFQTAYEDLTHTHASFDARLLQCIDDMLAAPVPSTPVLVHRPNAAYEFVDDSLEALSVGQKLMLRIGPEQAALVKAKLRALRSELALPGPTATGGR